MGRSFSYWGLSGLLDEGDDDATKVKLRNRGNLIQFWPNIFYLFCFSLQHQMMVCGWKFGTFRINNVPCQRDRVQVPVVQKLFYRLMIDQVCLSILSGNSYYI